MASTVTVYLYNNSVEDTVTSGIYVTANKPIDYAVNLDVTAENNISLDNGTDYSITRTGGATGSTTFNNNMSSDSTAGGYGGSGNLTSKSAANQYVDPTSDLNLLATADAKDAGKIVSAFSTDNQHSIGWRPQGSAWDMGALEKYVAPGQADQVIMVGL